MREGKGKLAYRNAAGWGALLGWQAGEYSSGMFWRPGDFDDLHLAGTAPDGTFQNINREDTGVTANATVLGPHRAKVVIPANATAGNLTVTTSTTPSMK